MTTEPDDALLHSIALESAYGSDSHSWSPEHQCKKAAGIAYRAGHAARDAEVAALKAENERLRELLTEVRPFIGYQAWVPELLAKVDTALVQPSRWNGRGYSRRRAMWQPIESAPRDGTPFQAWVKRGDTPEGVGWWEPECRVNEESGAFEIYGRVDYDEDGWAAYPHLTAVAWQDHPEPPADGE